MDQAPYWQANQTALRQSPAADHAMLLEALAPLQATADFQLCTTPAGDYTLAYQGVFLHSQQGAMQEAAETVLKQCHPGVERAHLLMGLGLGYVLDTLYQHSPGHIVVYEPDLRLLKFILENVDLSEAWGSGRVQLVTCIPDALAALRPYAASENPLDILLVPGEAERLHQDIPPLMAQLVDMVEERVRDFRTGQHFHQQWTRQFFQNLPHFAQTTPFAAVAPWFEGKPALIIGRGPSLDAAIDNILALADSMTLIAAGSALHRLHQGGITPDMAVFYDANGVKEQLHGLPDAYLREIIFCISPFSESLCFTAPSQAKVLFYPQSGEAFAEWLAASPNLDGESPFARPLILEGGGTVSLLAMQLALALQSSSITLVGQDLAFPKNQVYAGGVAVQQDEQGRLALPQSDALFTAPEAMTTVLGQNNEPLPALKAYAGFIRHFERLAEVNAQNETPIPFYNASLGGAAIAGYTLTPLSAFQKSYPSFHTHPSETKAKAALPAEITGGASETPAPRTSDTLRLALSQLRTALWECIELHEATLPEQPASPTAPPPGHTPNQALFAFLNQHPLIAHFLFFELMSVQQRYIAQPDSTAEIEANQALLTQSTHRCMALLREEIIPLIVHAEGALEAQRHPVPAPFALGRGTAPLSP